MVARLKHGFTLIEILIVVVIMAVLASVVIPQFSNSTKQAQTSTTEFNLQILRSQVELYRNQHGGRLPSAGLTELLKTTDMKGNVGSGTSYPYGPYLQTLPVNALTEASTVTATTKNPPTSSDVTADEAGGWLYNATTGGVWVDHADLIDR